jgi:nucleotide-binding universal stress UspA family protein
MSARETNSAPVVVGYDGSPAADRAVRAAGGLLAGRRALVVVVWKVGVGWELVELPAVSLGLPPSSLDVRTALEIDQDLAERAQRLATQGAELARESGFEAEGLAIAEDLQVTVAEAILRVARENGAQAVVVGVHGHGRIGESLLGSTSRDVIRSASCPVVVARQPSPAQDASTTSN